MRKYIIILLGLLAVQNIALHAQQKIDDYLAVAAKNNPDLKAQFNAYLAALEQIPQVKALPDPTVAFGYFIQPVETRVGAQQAKVSIAQMFPWFGMRTAKENVAIEMAQSKYELFEESKSKLFYEVKSIWYSLYYTNKAIAVTQNNIRLLKTLKKLALVVMEAGKASAVDELAVEMEILDLENQLQQLVDKRQTQIVDFNNLLNVDTTADIDLPEELQPLQLIANKEAILDSIRQNNHQILSLNYRQVSHKYQQTVARKMGKPNFSVGMDYTFVGKSSNAMPASGESGKDAILFPMVGISIPIYRKKYTAMIKESSFLHEAAQNQKTGKIKTLESIYEKAYAGYTDSQRRIDLHNKQLELAEKSLRLLQSEYTTEGKNFTELLRMERQILSHQLALEKAKADVGTNLALITYLMGR
ncbi:TolC family protein [Geofilum sp. OHC36d9]|uniref:TolC family protein n=1 Tax=Geofilum sp. OHC36d9 TaxID=3458413 RepID=UPI0040331F97